MKYTDEQRNKARVDIVHPGLRQWSWGKEQHDAGRESCAVVT